MALQMGNWRYNPYSPIDGVITLFITGVSGPTLYEASKIVTEFPP